MIMNRRVRRRLSHSRSKNEAAAGSNLELSDVESMQRDGVCGPDWTTLHDDIVIQLFSCLNYRDRASLSSTCRAFRLLGSSPTLWDSLDLRCHKFDATVTMSLSLRCKYLHKLQFRGASSADAIIHLQARKLCEISGDCCQNLTDATLSVIAARHEMLECLQLGPDACERISSDAIKAIAFCCPQLKRLQLSGVKQVRGDAINALASHCKQLNEVAFLESEVLDEEALGNLASVQFLSVTGTRNLKWGVALQAWNNMPKLVGLDVSRTDISLSSVMRLSSFSAPFKVLIALNCPVFESEVENEMAYNIRGRVIISVFSDISKAVASLFADITGIENDMFSCWRLLKGKNRRLENIFAWLERDLSHILLQIAESNSNVLDVFWLKWGIKPLISLMQSSQDDVKERAAAAVATFVVVDDSNTIVDSQRAEAFNQNGGIQLLLDLAISRQEGLQIEAIKAIANLSVDSKVAKSIADGGGINILVSLTRSMNRLIAEEAAGGLWNLSVGDDHKVAIAEAGGTKALVDLISKWPFGCDGVLERAAGALANLAADHKCCIELALTGGVHALVTLAKSCKHEGVQEQAARALANLATHGNVISNNDAVVQASGALEALIHLTCSQHEGVRQEAAGALWNLSFNDSNREAIAAAGGVKALVALAQSSSSFSHALQERAAGALWGLSVSETSSVAIGEEGGVAPLIALACSTATDVHETAVGALWNLAFNAGNALRIVENGGVPALVNLCSSSLSKLAHFMAALALAYVFDRTRNGAAQEGLSLEVTSKSLNLHEVRRTILKNIETVVLSFSGPQALASVMVSSSPQVLEQAAKALHIPEAGFLRCSAAEIAIFVGMLRNPSPILKMCSAFALLQFTMPGGRHALHHVGLLRNAGAQRVLRAAAAATTAPPETKVFAKVVLRNIELQPSDTSD